MKPTLLVIDHTVSPEDLKSHTKAPNHTYTLYLTSKKTKQHQKISVENLLKDSPIPDQNHIHIDISAIIQKTWRIIKHYATSPKAPQKGAKDRSKSIQALAQINQKRLKDTTTKIEDMIINDQSLLLSADRIDLRKS